MEGFKNTTKIQYFKEGGFVTKKEFTKNDKKEDKVKDTQMVKKGVRQHESALHKGEPKTELKLKTGGRAKKDCGTVRKYKTGGMVENAYAAKKTDKDIKDIANTKRQKPAMLCGGKSVKNMREGRLTAPEKDPNMKIQELLKQRDLEKMARAKKYLGPAQQSELINQSPAAAGLTPPAPVGLPAAAPSAPMKKGGKAKKC